MTIQEIKTQALDQSKWNPRLFYEFDKLSPDEQLEVIEHLKRHEEVDTDQFAYEVQKYLLSQKSVEGMLVSFDEIEQQEAEFLIPQYLPKGAITMLAGEGGSGKTSTWCAIAAALSAGKMPFMVQSEMLPEKWHNIEPMTILAFSAEDSASKVLKARLIKNGAVLKNIKTIEQGNDHFTELGFTSPLLERLIMAYHPDLCIFDPVQSFIPTNLHMGERNAMRQCLQPLAGYGEKYGTTFLIIVHANKQMSAWGRKRMADSSDFWDIARSVLMVGETGEGKTRYISQEKNNYGALGLSVLFTISPDGVPEFCGYTDQKDRDFVTEHERYVRSAPARDNAREFVLDYLGTGVKLVADLDEVAIVNGISKSALRRVKEELKAAGTIRIYAEGYGKDKKWYARLAEDEADNDTKD